MESKASPKFLTKPFDFIILKKIYYKKYQVCLTIQTVFHIPA